jgi:dolichol-phosphate mannosyltransferase
MLLSFVIPARNEMASLPELLRRCRDVGQATGQPFEIIVIDDGSSDGTAEWIQSHPELEVRRLHHAVAAGHLASVRHGLAEAKGLWVAVLDGDLQDPPEVVTALLEHARAPDTSGAVFAVKARRDDPLPFLIAQGIFHRLQHTFARVPIPLGASTCCVLSRDLARKVAAFPLAFGNVAAIVAALKVRADWVSYERGARFGGKSRLGLPGHTRQAVVALALTGALSRIAWTAALVLIALALPMPEEFRGSALLFAVTAGAVGIVASLAYESRVRHVVGTPAAAADGLTGVPR